MEGAKMNRLRRMSLMTLVWGVLLVALTYGVALAATVMIHCETDDEYCAGTNYEDTIYGTDEADDVSGHYGNDDVFGGAGWDSLWGGPGSDEILDPARRDYDEAFGGRGNDVIN